MSAAPETARRLEYARAGVRRRRGWGFWVLLVVVAVGVVGRRAVGEGWQRGQLVYALWQCAHYTAPADRVVFEEGPYDPGLKVPEVYSAPVKGGTPACWKVVREQVVGGNRFPQATLFLHRLRSANGTERVVHVGRSWQGYEMMPLNLQCVIVHPVGLRGAVKVDEDTVSVFQETEVQEDLGMAGVFPFMIQPGRTKIRLFAGQADPQDAARFVIPLEIDGKRREIVGRLGDSGFVSFALPAEEGTEEETEEATEEGTEAGAEGGGGPI